MQDRTMLDLLQHNKKKLRNSIDVKLHEFFYDVQYADRVKVAVLAICLFHLSNIHEA